MPIYEYRCRECGGDFEKYLATSATTVACPSCQSDRVMRKLSIFGMKSDSPGTVASMPSGGGCCGGGCGCH